MHYFISQFQFYRQHALPVYYTNNTINVLKKTITRLECGLMPNMMAALPNIGGTLCSTPPSLADAHY